MPLLVPRIRRPAATAGEPATEPSSLILASCLPLGQFEDVQIAVLRRSEHALADHQRRGIHAPLGGETPRFLARLAFQGMDAPIAAADDDVFVRHGRRGVERRGVFRRLEGPRHAPFFQSMASN